MEFLRLPTRMLFLRLLSLFLIHHHDVTAVPADNCSGSEHLEFVRDDADICGYYLCSGGVFQADPASNNIYHACAGGASTINAPIRSFYSPCSTIDPVCSGVVDLYVSQKYSPVGGTGNGHGNGGKPTPGTTQPTTTTTTRVTPTVPTVTTTTGHHGGGGNSNGGGLTLSTPVAIFQHAHVQGGRHVEAYRVDYGPVTIVTSRDLCHHVCDLNVTCTAYDWNEPTATCWIHTELTACGKPMYKQGCTHVRFDTCGDKSTEAPATLPPVETTKLHPASTTTSYPGYPPGHAKGFVETHVDMHAKGGKLVLTNGDDESCRAYCMHFPTCAAVEYDSLTQTCWLHEESTACGQLVNTTRIIHHKRLRCQPHSDVAPRFLSGIPGAHVQDGVQTCSNCTMHYCQHLCLADAECAGVDYNAIYGTCYKHTMHTVCNLLETKLACTHFSRFDCGRDYS